ncbi:Dam family site-specific DNA-(adenine-N6)-methyltransferase [Thalassovita sp.]|uniref:Dam family site-specific DNA-(adenine-N6)-methyltransferase n=1 Tax=Thalassovita sp. TaxID=1979401 RepID=UPI003B637169
MSVCNDIYPHCAFGSFLIKFFTLTFNKETENQRWNLESSQCTPLLRWAGSKRGSLPPLINKWRNSQKTKYIEPFCGSAALFFALAPKSAVLSDQNAWLIRTYQTIRNFPQQVSALSNSFKRDKPTYLTLRAEDHRSMDDVRSAAIFVYLNRNCFNGIFRTNKAGNFNVPFSDSRTGK